MIKQIKSYSDSLPTVVVAIDISGPYNPEDTALTYTVYLVLALRPVTLYSVAVTGLDVVI